jgi:hypothetical protein
MPRDSDCQPGSHTRTRINIYTYTHNTHTLTHRFNAVMIGEVCREAHALLKKAREQPRLMFQDVLVIVEDLAGQAGVDQCVEMFKNASEANTHTHIHTYTHTHTHTGRGAAWFQVSG